RRRGGGGGLGGEPPPPPPTASGVVGRPRGGGAGCWGGVLSSCFWGGLGGGDICVVWAMRNDHSVGEAPCPVHVVHAFARGCERAGLFVCALCACPAAAIRVSGWAESPTPPRAPTASFRHSFSGLRSWGPGGGSLRARAPRPAAVHPPRRSPSLIGRRVERLVV